MLIRGDLFDVLPTLEEASIDACVTDPPYGIGFMGREWDTFSPKNVTNEFDLRQRQEFKAGVMSANIKGRKRTPAASPSQIQYNRTLEGQRGFQDWTERWAREVFRVLKPGAHLVVCGAPRSHHRMMCGLEDAGFEIRDCLAWIFGQGFPKSLNLGAGWGTALKPGHEPIALARKPFTGSTTACHATNGTAGLNVDGCRIEGEAWHREPGENPKPWTGSVYAQDEWTKTHMHGGKNTDGSDLGRWPANVLLDVEAAALLDEQSGDCPTGKGGGPSWGATDGVNEGWKRPAHANYQPKPDAGFGDSGGASRFFYVAKPSREERNYGHGSNRHPTVKPVELMRWLVRLVTPQNGTVLDPFAGSGTTGMACRYELREFVGIEREAEYVEIAERRIAACVPLFANDGDVL